jgi:hypothetical protein
MVQVKDGRVVGQWAQPDLFSIYRQISDREILGTAGVRACDGRLRHAADLATCTRTGLAMGKARHEPPVAGQEPFAACGTERSASLRWVNRVTVLPERELFTLETLSTADYLSPTPTLVVLGRTDLSCLPQGAAGVYDRLGEPKDLLWLDTTNHVDLYDQEPYVAPALARAAAWLDEHLSGHWMGSSRHQARIDAVEERACRAVRRADTLAVLGRSLPVGARGPVQITYPAGQGSVHPFR